MLLSSSTKFDSSMNVSFLLKILTAAKLLLLAYNPRLHILLLRRTDSNAKGHKSEVKECKQSRCFETVNPAVKNSKVFRKAWYIQVLIEASCIFVRMLVAKIT